MEYAWTGVLSSTTCFGEAAALSVSLCLRGPVFLPLGIPLGTSSAVTHRGRLLTTRDQFQEDHRLLSQIKGNWVFYLSVRSFGAGLPISSQLRAMNVPLQDKQHIANHSWPSQAGNNLGELDTTVTTELSIQHAPGQSHRSNK